MILIVGGFGQDKRNRFEAFLRDSGEESFEEGTGCFPERILDGEEILNHAMVSLNQTTNWTAETLVKEIQAFAPDGINHFHSLMRSLFLDGVYDRIRQSASEGSKNYLDDLEDYLWEELRETYLGCKWILCDEVGNGVIPISGADRDYRMLVGRLQTRLAVEAESVYRMTCGIPVKIK